MLWQGFGLGLGLMFGCTQDFVAIKRMQYICTRTRIILTYLTLYVLFSHRGGYLYTIIVHAAWFICMFK